MSEIKKYITETRLSKDERECILNFSEVDNMWYADVSVAKLRNKFVKRGWKLTSETVLPDGTWVASTFEAPYWAVSVRNSERASREITDEQRQMLADRAKERFRKE